MIREIRKYHRDVGRKQRLAPRVSDEDKKWLSWPEYLRVVGEHHRISQSLLEAYDGSDPSSLSEFTKEHRDIAYAMEIFLVLAFFANIPDRQRTIRELEIDRSFVRERDAWGIKHSPADYKTGKTYGDRPLMLLPTSLTPFIDEYLTKWRLCLRPQTKHVFVQPRTGKPLSGDSLYRLFVQACFRITGKRTNPHLLRDMVVTHVRESDASEKELEALALYMGHSVAIQRSSYDRRTLDKKVEPAMKLLHSVNDILR